MEITIYSILVWLASILIVSLDIVIFLGSKNFSSRVFAGFTFVSALWAATYGLHMTFLNADIALFLVKVELVMGIIISSGFYYFSGIYPDDKVPKNNLILISSLIFVVFIFYFFYIHTDFLVYNAFMVNDPQRWGWEYNMGTWAYALVFAILWILGLRNIYNRFSISIDNRERSNLKYMLSALLIGVSPPFILDVVLPFSNFFKFGWIGPITSAIWISIIAYSIAKYRQMNVRVVVAEVLAIGMTIIFFINIFVGFPLGVVGRIGTFIIFIFLAYFLITVVLRESKHKEQLKDLNDNLEKRVAEQTEKIRSSYEIEKKAHEELQNLDRNKNDFIIVTQHYLRTPLTQIRWYISSILSGLYGDLSPDLERALTSIGKSSEKLTKTLNNFLDISELKIGTQLLKKSQTSIKYIIESVLDENSKEIRRRKITVSTDQDDSHWPIIEVDMDRMREVFAILIDNAIRYNVNGGEIAVTAKKIENKLQVLVSNTGLTLTQPELKKIFTQSFFRTKKSKELNPTGMGVSLLVAKTIVKAHAGEIELMNDKTHETTQIKITFTNLVK